MHSDPGCYKERYRLTRGIKLGLAPAVMVETSDSAFGYEAAGQRMKASEIALARLLQALGGPAGCDFNDYLQRIGAVVTPGE
jgi:hypothetical protein